MGVVNLAGKLMTPGWPDMVTWRTWMYVPRGEEPRAAEKLSGTNCSRCTPAAPVETSSWCCDSTVLNGTAGTPAKEVSGVP